MVAMVISVVAMVMSVMAMVMSGVGRMMMLLCTCLHFGGVLKQAADVGEDGKGNDGGKADQ